MTNSYLHLKDFTLDGNFFLQSSHANWSIKNCSNITVYSLVLIQKFAESDTHKNLDFFGHQNHLTEF